MISLPSQAYASSYSLSLASRLTPVGRIARAAETGDWKRALEALSDRPLAARLSQGGDPLMVIDGFVSSELSSATSAVGSVSGALSAMAFAEAYSDFLNLSSLLGGSRSYLSHGLMGNDVLASELVGKGAGAMAQVLRRFGYPDLASALEGEDPRRALMGVTLERLRARSGTPRLSAILSAVVDHWNFSILAFGKGAPFQGGRVTVEVIERAGEPEAIANLCCPVLARALERPEFSGLILDVSLSRSVWGALAGDPVTGDLFLGAYFSLLVERSLYRHLYLALEVYSRASELTDILGGLR